jgi:outer membrane protein assembly factor BamE (lipoprotein component of BamABCDE complex)
MIRRVAAPLCVLLATAALASACAPTSQFQGFQAIDAKPADIKVGTDTKSTVLTRLGSPSVVSTFDPNIWFYISQVTQYESFYKPQVIRRDVVEVAFDKKDEKVAALETLSLKDGRVIAFNGRETPTRGRELTALEQILGSLGQGSLLGSQQDVNPGQERTGGGH